MDDVVWIKDFTEDYLVAGGIKALRLSELYNIGVNTLPGFVILNSVFERFLTENNIYSDIVDIFERFEEMGLEDLRDATRDLERKLMACTIPWDMEMDLRNYHKKLAEETGNKPVVIRPSYYLVIKEEHKDTEEKENEIVADVYYSNIDPEALSSKAIGIKGYINIVSEDEFLSKLLKFWRNIYNYELFKWCKEYGKINPSVLRFGTIVQSVLYSESYGSMVTYTPTKSPEEGDKYIQIRARHGFCSESLYDPTPDIEFYTPRSSSPWDIYLVDKKTLEIRDKHITLQAMEFAPNPNGGLLQQPLQMDIGSSQKIDDGVIKNLARIGIDLENYYKMPVYVQWGVANRRPYIFECRKLASLEKEMKKSAKKEPIEAQAKDLGEEVVANVVSESDVKEDESVEGIDLSAALDTGMVTEFRTVDEEETKPEDVEVIVGGEDVAKETTASLEGDGIAAGGYFLKIKAPPIMIYCDVSDKDAKGLVDLYYDSIFISVDSIVKDVLKKHPLHFVQDKDVEAEFIDAVVESIRREIRPHIVSLYVLLSNLTSQEYMKFDDAMAYEDPDLRGNDYRGVLRAVLDDEFMDLYKLELNALKLASERFDIKIHALFSGVRDVSMAYTFHTKMGDVLRNHREYIKPGLYVDNISSVFSAQSLCSVMPLASCVFDLSAIYQSVVGGNGVPSDVKYRVKTTLHPNILSSINDALDVLDSGGVEYIARLAANDVDYINLRNVLLMGFPAIIVPKSHLLHVTRVLNTIERQHSMFSEDD